MGRIVKNFRQTAKSLSGSLGARNFAKFNRRGSWYSKIINSMKVRGKNYGQS